MPMRVLHVEFCETHDELLNSLIEQSGLAGLNSTDPTDTFSRAIDFVQRGKITVDNFDPKRQAVYNILSNAYELVGDSIFLLDTCLICTLNRVHGKTCQRPATCDFHFEEYIGAAVELQVETWKNLQP